ncbi:MAG: ABC-ATPase domain-containing protein [Deltaproteobacteria bacterium]|nr:ABC-ATPase domain-containing protein [Deltaproteobacteria bacterium]
MKPADDLKKTLFRIHDKGYKAYQDIEGLYLFSQYELSIDRVQADPFAPPSRVRVIISLKKWKIFSDLWENKIRRIAFCDFIGRQVQQAIRNLSSKHRGTGKSGMIAIEAGGPEILERTAVVINGEILELRLTVGLPASGRTISGMEAVSIFFEDLPKVIQQGVFQFPTMGLTVKHFVDAYEDQEWLRLALNEKGLLAFVPEGAILPRESGISSRPLAMGAVPFYPPQELSLSFHLPHKGAISGLGLEKGVILIVGGGFHGKSTLLRALELGIYSHVPGDGREYAVTDSKAVKIRAEEGRSVTKVNISPFIKSLPLLRDTLRFSTENASGSTSQATNIMEALEMGARVLLIDEDTSATNFMIRDRRMQELVKKAHEPITPFIDKVRRLYRDYGVSTVLVMGGSGDYFEVADTVIWMNNYRPFSVTSEARAIAEKFPVHRLEEGGESFGEITPRQPKPDSFDPSRGHKEVRIEAKSLETLFYGEQVIDLSFLEQIVETSQTRAIGRCIHLYATRFLENNAHLKEGLEKAMDEIEEKGLDELMPYKVGYLAKPRLFEIAGAINRLRSLQIKS